MEPNASLHQSIQTLYQQIEHHCNQQEWQDVITTCQQLLQIQPSFNLYKTLGVAFQRKAELETAFQWYLKALEIKPDDADIYNNIGSVYAQQKQWQDAILNYQVALRLNPNLEKTYLNLGNILERVGQLEEAIIYYRQLINLNPNLALAYQKLGDAFFKLKRWDDAIFAFCRVLELEPQALWSCLHLGKSYIYKQQWQQAIETCLQAIKIHPQAAWSYKNLGDIFSHQKRWNDAISAYIYAIRVRENPFNAGFMKTIYQRLGYAIHQQIQQSNLENTINWLYQVFQSKTDKFTQDYPLSVTELGFTVNTPQAYLELAESLADYQQFEAAIVFYKLAEKSQKNSTQINQKIRQTREKKQKFEILLSECYQSIEKYPDTPDAYTKIGNLLTQQGQTQEAIFYHQKALILKGWYLCQQRNYQFTYDWFSNNIPIWEKHLKFLSPTPELNILEIGSYQGMSTCWFLDYLLTHPTAKITCIDPYFKSEFDHNIRETGFPEKVIKKIGYSQDILSSLQPNFYDIVYVDGCHQAQAAFQDTLQSWRLTKIGGIIIFDDYEVNEPNNPEQQAKIGIDYFLNGVYDGIEIINKGYQLMIRKTAEGLPDE